MSDITDAGPRLKAMNDALEASDRLQAEIERLRLTDAERGLLDMLADHPVTHQIMPHEVATLRGLLERFSDRPKPIATPAPSSTPGEGT